MGGEPFNAFAFVYDHGITSETCSPYQALDTISKGEQCGELNYCKTCSSDGSCSTPKNYTKYHISTFGAISGEQEMKAHLAAFGPIACNLYDPLAFDYYLLQSDIFDPKLDKIPMLNHSLEVVGWTKKDEQDVWIVRNSIGSTWGDMGYAYLVISDDETKNLAIQRQCSWGLPKLSPAEEEKFFENAKAAFFE